MTIAPQPEHQDSYTYNWISFYRESVVFFLESLKFYESLLKGEEETLINDAHLNNFLSEDLRREFRVGRDLQRITKFIEWIESKLNEAPSRWDIDLSLNHGSVRLLKSVGLLYLGFLKQRRNKLSSDPNCSQNLLDALDRGITAQEDALNTMGVFKNASLIPLTVAQTTVDTPPKEQNSTEQSSIAKTERPKPQIVSTIEILDSELRRRCLDLFNQFENDGQSDRHDTVIAEATRILEDRLRKLTKSEDNATAAKLISRAFDGNKPLIKASEIPGEQDGAQQLFRGLFGYIRNQFQHKLVSDISPERVLQILGLVDYLIAIVNSANPAENEPSQNS